MTLKLIFLFCIYGILCNGTAVNQMESINKYKISKALPSDSAAISKVFIPHSDLPEKLQQVLKESREKIEIEGLKPYYLAGENINLEIFVKNLPTKTSNKISNTLYLDFIDLEKGKLMKHFIIRLSEGKAIMKYQIDNALTTGNYLIRSYTNWMRNFSDKDFFFQKTTVFSQTYLNELSQKSKEAYLDTIIVFAEGNKLVEGLNNRLIVKTINNFGVPFQANFQILSSANHSIINGETDSLGMAYFDFTPLPNLEYRIFAQNKSFPFHKIEKIGTTLKIDNLSYTEKLKVLVQNQGVTNLSDTLHLLILKENEIVFCQPFANNKSAVIFSIPKTNMKGELCVYLTDQNFNTIIQRKISIEKERTFDKSIQIDRNNIVESPSDFFAIKKDLPFWDEKGITIKGQVTRLNGKPNKKPIKISAVLSGIPTDSVQITRQNFTMESIDKISLEDLLFYGKKQITFIAPNNRVVIDTSANIPEINRERSPINWGLLTSKKDNSEMQTRMEQLFEESLKKQKNEVTLDEVKVFATKMDQYKVEGLTPAFVMEEKEIINKPYLNDIINLMIMTRINRFNSIPVFIDNQKLSADDVKNINDLVSPASVESIQIFEDIIPVSYGINGNNCAIVIKLRRGAMKGLEKKNESIIVHGYDF